MPPTRIVSSSTGNFFVRHWQKYDCSDVVVWGLVQVHCDEDIGLPAFGYRLRVPLSGIRVAEPNDRVHTHTFAK